MPKAVIEEHGSVAIVRMQNGVANPIGPGLVAALEKSLTAVEKEFQGVVLSGGEKFFSIGFNLPVLLSFDRPRMADFFSRFNNLVLRLFLCPLPTACAVVGHAIAGGTILALAADFCLAADKKPLMGLNEVKLGVPVPYLADLMLRQRVSDRSANRILYSGEFFPATDAQRMGIVDETLPLAQVEDRAVERVAAVAALPRHAFSAIKESRTETIRQRYEARGREACERFLDCWFAPSTRPLLEKAAETFSHS